jgi:hypothetical protein
MAPDPDPEVRKEAKEEAARLVAAREQMRKEEGADG